MTSELGGSTMCTRGGGWNGRWLGRCCWGMPLGLLALELALMLSSFFAPCSAQVPGWVSIDCGSEVNYTDSETGIQWVTDSGYTSLGYNSPKVVDKNSTPDSPTQPYDARYFTDGRKKYCYVLPVEADTTYLVRSTFLLLPLTNINGFAFSNLNFDVYVNSTYWTTLLYGGTPLNPGFYPWDLRTFEIIFRSTGRELSVCLVRGQGDPFISSLALRKLDDGMYSRVLEGGASTPMALFVYLRYNFGVDPLNGTFATKYPDDKYDRVWENFGPSNNTRNAGGEPCPAVITTTRALSSFPQNASDNNQAPLKVMQSACTAPTGNISLNRPFTSPVQMYYAVLYLQEINDSVTAANPRRMSVDAIDVKTESVNVTANVTQLNTPAVNLSSINFSVVLSRLTSTTAAPIVNAAEFSGERPLNLSATSPSDVVAISELRDGVNLGDWTGDPCYPQPWDWVTCNGALPEARISAVWLSNQSLSGFIAPSISSLTQLTILKLDNNNLNGSLPDLQNLTNLQLLDLQNNFLSGSFPAYLFSSPNLTQLYVQNNNLTGAVPDCRPHSDLAYECDGNSELQRCRPGRRSCSSSSGGYSARTVWIVVGASLGGVALVTFVIGLLVFLLRSRRMMKQASAPPSQRLPMKPIIMPQPSMMFHGEERDRATAFTFEQIAEATDNFADKIGEGSFGPVYRGKLPDGKEIAVKTNAGSSRQGTAEFVNEVNLLSRVHHKNLVSLLGFCEERAELILVYDYMANGTVREHLYSLPEGRTPLSWATRLNVAISAAKGLEYLHTACTPRIIHRDVKSSNILLDSQMVAKVADFGLSKSGADLGFTSGFSTVIKGTPGYFDPEYFVTKKLTLKSDVYSFGIVLLEIVCGRPPYPSEVPDGSIRTLPEWMHATINTEIFAIVDPALEGRYNEESMRKVIELAAECLEQRNHRRPDSTEVVIRLSHARDLEPSASSRVRRSLDSNILNSPLEPSGSVSSFSALINPKSSAAYMSTDVSYNEGR